MKKHFKPAYQYLATLIKVVDGDTIDIRIDLGFHVMAEERIRIARINAPELKGEEAENGKLTKQRVIELLPEGTEIVVATKKDRTDTYGRYIGEIIFWKEDKEVNLSDLLLTENLAKPY